MYFAGGGSKDDCPQSPAARIPVQHGEGEHRGFKEEANACLKSSGTIQKMS